MIRALAFSVLLALGVSLVAPAVVPAPASAATGAVVEGGLPPVPWPSIGRWLLKNALTLLMLVEEIWRDLQSGGHEAPPGQVPPTPLTVEAG